MLCNAVVNLASIYDRVVLKSPLKVIFFFLYIFIVSIYYSFDFELDASGESLVLENDQSLNYYRQISEKYASHDFVIITYQPDSGLLSETTLATIRGIRDQLLQLESIESVTSILDVPIIYESGLSLFEITAEFPSLGADNVSDVVAAKEFETNPLYRDLIVSEDGSVTAIQALFKRDYEYNGFLERRRNLIERLDVLSQQELLELEQIKQDIRTRNNATTIQREIDIKRIRDIIEQHRDSGQLYLGGIPMITVDMIQFIKHDLLVFGLGVFLFLIIILSIFFRKLRWVIIPMLVCGITGVATIGFLGYVSWPVTVISSNFLSILLIITLSLNIHLIVRFRDLQLHDPETPHIELIRLTMASMVRPCFYTVLTTAVAFASLVVSEIKPVVGLGWIMVIGLCIAFIVSFTVMPALLSIFKRAERVSQKDRTRKITLRLAKFVHDKPLLITIASLFLIVLLGIGIMQLKVENRFINNFKSNTEIYQGMKLIDHKLGGTMPLDIIIEPDKDFFKMIDELAAETNELDSLFLDEGDELVQPNYWLNPAMVKRMKRIQEHLESYPVIGKVISIVTSLMIVEKLNGAPFDEFELALVRNRIPDSIKASLIAPYLSEDSNQVRFSMRIVESDPTLSRQELLDSIHNFLIKDMGFEEQQVHLTGMMILYNNMLQSLFRSQILTIGAVFITILIMFMIIFRNIQLSLIAIVPNIFSAVLILGIMGWAGIPLDMMTITIAAITIGISVDDTIHYVHCLQQEYSIDSSYEEAIICCHGGIGKAMYYTSVAIFFGFALLACSNFIPTVYFGLLTGFAMLVALFGDLLLLPAMVLILKPKII
tara:strand:+ start:757 stop:3243 length:2487 start_codon:yes stop_codon:yes gene_type:complete